MSKLTVIDFDGFRPTDAVFNKLSSLQKEYLIDLEDACVVEHRADGKVDIEADGEVNTKEAVKLTACGAVSGGSWGAMWVCWSGFSSLIRSLERQLVRLPAPGAC